MSNPNLLIFPILICLFACGEPEKQPIVSMEQAVQKIDTTTLEGKKSEKQPPVSQEPPVQKIDTSTLDGKRQFIFQQADGCCLVGDTLLDLNFDGHDDYILKTYGQAGTGLKNRVAVYLFNPKTNTYNFDERLSELPNPSFFMGEKTITSFYIGQGSGEGQKLQWKKGMWIATKEFTVQNRDDDTVWKVFYPLKNRKEKIVKPFQMVPLKEIFRTSPDL